MAGSITAQGAASLSGLDDFLDPDIERILDEADLMEAVTSISATAQWLSLCKSLYKDV